MMTHQQHATFASEFATLLLQRIGVLWGHHAPILKHFVLEESDFLFQQRVSNLPILLTRLYDVAGCLGDLFRLEEGLGIDEPKEQFTMTVKAREQLRKAIKEFETVVVRCGGGSLAQGLPDVMRPVLEKAAGVLEESLVNKENLTQSDDSSAPTVSDDSNDYEAS